MEGDPDEGHQFQVPHSSDEDTTGTKEEADAPPTLLSRQDYSSFSSDEEEEGEWSFPPEPSRHERPMDSISLGLSNIPTEADLQHHRETLHAMLSALSTQGTLPPEYRHMIADAPTVTRTTENMVHHYARPSVPPADDSQLIDLLSPNLPSLPSQPLHPNVETRKPHKKASATTKKHINRLERKENSKFSFYAVNKGLRGHQLHFSWNNAKLEVLDPRTGKLFPWAVVRGFDDYDAAINFLGWDKKPPPSHLHSQSNDKKPRPSSKPSAPKATHKPKKAPHLATPAVPSAPVPQQSILNQPPPFAFGNNTMSNIPPWLYPYFQATQPAPTKFTAWPKFGKDSDFYVFYLKLSTILDTPEWGNGSLISATETTPELSQKSSLLFQGLLSCLEDKPLLPFVNNAKYANKGIEMLQELFRTYGGFEGKTDQEMLIDFYTCKINPGESIDDFALRLRTFSIRLRSLNVKVTEFQLTNTFVYGLCDNFKDIKSSHDKKTLEWRHHGLEWAKREAKGIKSNLQKNSNWSDLTSSAGTACAASTTQGSTSTYPSSKNHAKHEKSWLRKEPFKNHDLERLFKTFCCPLHQKDDHPLCECNFLLNFFDIRVKPGVTLPQSWKCSTCATA
jgi:hypothetical protein